MALEERTHYVCRVRLDGVDRFVIWFADEVDGLVRSADGRVVRTRSAETLAESAVDLGVTLRPDAPAVYDFDAIDRWCRSPVAEDVICNAFLNAWNFFGDVAERDSRPESEFALLDREADLTYEMLFEGCNLPSVTKPGDEHHPSWSAWELDQMRVVFEAGLRLLRRELAD
jgi:hypothetical protein